MEERDFRSEILNILNSDISVEEKRAKLSSYHETDIADALDELDSDERSKAYEILGNELVGDVLSHQEDIDEIIDEIKPEKVADILETMDADDAIDILEELDEEKKDQIVSLMDKDAVHDIKAITKYDDDQIGSKMTNNYITISRDDSVKSAMKKVIADAAENDNISVIYALNPDGTLYGTIELRSLIIARKDTELASIIKTNYPSIPATEKVSDVINDLKDYGLDSYPVVDEKNHLIGVITSDDVIESVDDEAGEDYVKFAAITEEEDIDESVFHSVRKRIPWLLILLVLDLVIAFTMSNFDGVVAALPIVAFFQTLVLDMAGNSGTQSLAVTIRRISTEEVDGKMLAKTILKELLIGLLNGLLLGILAFGFVLLFLKITNQGAGTETFEIVSALKCAGIVGFSLFFAMIVAAFIGSTIPIIFYKIKIDPAVASGPFITTINDVVALLIYYGLAMILFANLL